MRKFDAWREVVLFRCLKVNKDKTVAMVTGEEVQRVESIRFLC